MPDSHHAERPCADRARRGGRTSRGGRPEVVPIEGVIVDGGRASASCRPGRTGGARLGMLPGPRYVADRLRRRCSAGRETGRDQPARRSERGRRSNRGRDQGHARMLAREDRGSAVEGEPGHA